MSIIAKSHYRKVFCFQGGMGEMNTKQLEDFIVIANRKSISAAAKELYVSQSALTYEIQKLEQEIGGTLLIRNSKGVELTSEGELFKDTCEKVLFQLQECTTKIREQSRIASQIFKLGHHRPMSDPFLADFFSEAMREFPQTTVDLIIQNSAKLLNSVQDEMIDAAVVLPRTIKKSLGISVDKIPGIRARRLFSSEEMCIIRKDLLQDSVSCFYPNDLLNHKIILPDNNVPTHSVPWLKNIEEDNIIRPANLDAAIVLARAGMGILVVPGKVYSLPRVLAQIPFETGEKSEETLIWRENASPKITKIAEVMTSFYLKQRIIEKQ